MAAIYEPTPPPSSDDLQEIKLWAYGELAKLAALARNPDGLYLTPQRDMLPRPREGDLMYAGAGVYGPKAGLYYYSSTGWRYVSNQNPP